MNLSKNITELVLIWLVICLLFNQPRLYLTEPVSLSLVVLSLVLCAAYEQCKFPFQFVICYQRKLNISVDKKQKNCIKINMLMNLNIFSELVKHLTIPQTLSRGSDTRQFFNIYIFFLNLRWTTAALWFIVEIT